MFSQKLGQVKKMIEVARLCKKPIICVGLDYWRLRRKKSLSWNEYYNFEFERQTFEFKRNFLGGVEEGVYLELLNPYRYYILARNKYLAHIALEQAFIPTPELYCFYNPECDSTIDGCISFDVRSTKEILEKKQVYECVVKTPEGSHGNAVFAVIRIDYSENDALLETTDGKKITLSSILLQYPLLFEQKVNQSAQFERFNPSSVNTVRFMTILLPTGEARVIATFIKIGRSGAFVDNAGSGGNVDAGINVETGEIYGAMEFNGFRKIRSIDYHPDTGTRLNGVKIRNWNQICTQLCNFQQRFPFLKAIGWDVAITDNGPVIIEINDFGDTTGQLFIQKGWGKEIRECYMAWKKYNNERDVNYCMGRNNPASNAVIQKIEKLTYYSIAK